MNVLAPLAPLAAASVEHGGKAHGLARLLAVGAPVPPGVVVPAAAFTATVGALPAELPWSERAAALAHLASAAEHAEAPGLAAAVTAAATELGPRVIVRSSLAVEDRATGAAPGVGASTVVPAAEAWLAVRSVWASALTPLVAAYARAAPGAVIAAPTVIVQRYEPGFRATVYTRPPGRPDDPHAWIACGPGAPTVIPRDGDGATWREALALARLAEDALAAPAGVDVELVWAFARSAWVIVQARPLVHPPPRPARTPAPPMIVAALAADGVAWRRDLAHNPAPLSVAQAELCARVEAAAIAPFRLRVVAHHLYWAARPDPPTPTITTAAALADAIAARERAVAELLAAPVDALDGALARYLAVYRILAGELGPLVAAGKAHFAAAMAAAAVAPTDALAWTPRPSSIGARLADAVAGRIDRATLAGELAAVAPSWDVAAPTLAETPARLDDALARAALRTATPSPAPPPPPALADAIAIGQVALDAGERDDLWYWRAQALVRHALLARAAALGLDGDDVFWLPFDALEGALTPETARGRAAAARAAAARAAAWDLPLSADGTPPAPAWRGAGVGGRAHGPAHHSDGTAAIPRGAIAVVRAITPALALALDGALAIVSDSGSPLDHGPAMARELGIPCVVGCAGAFDALAEGQWLAVDGDRGEVTPYASSPSSSS